MTKKEKIEELERKLARYEKYDAQMSRSGKHVSKRTIEAREELEGLRSTLQGRRPKS